MQSISVDNPDSGPGNWSITFNNEARKELDVRMAHVFVHEQLVSFLDTDLG